MNKSELHAFLEKHKEAIRKQSGIDQAAEDAFNEIAELGEDDVNLLGPSNDIEFARMKRDIKES